MKVNICGIPHEVVELKDEQFVQALGNAIYQGFTVKEV